jgi:CHAD domain-containing protein
MKRTCLSLKPDESLRAGLLRVVDSLVESVADRGVIPACARGEDVHTVRTTIKRLRAILRLIQPAISKTAFEREDSRLRQAAGRLSLARDTQVARQTLLALPVSNKREQEAVAAALTGLEADAEPQTGIDEAMRKVAVDLEQTRRSLHRLRFAGSEWNAIEPGLRKIYRQGRKRMNIALEDGDDAAFHKWRIRVKNLYYELQLLEPVWRKRLQKLLSRLAELQDKIGDDHDLVVLKSLLRKTPAAFGGTNTVERVIRSVDDKSRKLRRAIEPLGEAIFAATPRRFLDKLGQHWKMWRKASAGRNGFSKNGQRANSSYPKQRVHRHGFYVRFENCDGQRHLTH